MAVRQYIGARYIPKFMGEYDATTIYDALSVVDNGMGTSYIAKKTVPAGTLLSDTNYWAIYGATSGAILHLQDQIDFIDGILQLKGKTIAVFGSSNETDASTEGLCWVTSLETLLSGYATVVNKSTGGATLLSSISSYISDPDKNDYDIVLFTSTRNLYKLQTQADVGNNFNAQCNIETAFISLLSYKRDDQLFYFASCLPYTDCKKAIPMCLYDGVIKNLCAKYGFNMVDMHSWLGVNDDNSGSFTHDGTHYKAIYSPILAKRCITALLKNNEPFMNYSCSITGLDLHAHLVTYYHLINGVAVNVNAAERSILYCDVNLNIVLKAYMQNLTGAELSINTNILDVISELTGALIYSNNVIEQNHTNYGMDIDIQNRPFHLRLLTAVPDNSTFGIVRDCTAFTPLKSY